MLPICLSQTYASFKLNKQKKSKRKNEKSLSFNSTSTNENDSFEKKEENNQNILLINHPQFNKLSPSNLNLIFKQIMFQESEKIKPILTKNDFKNQIDINESHRSILIDWLINVHLYLKLSDECLFLTIRIVDKFLGNIKNFDKKNLELLGICSLFISSKFFESIHIKIEDLLTLCENAYCKNEIISFERFLFSKINYEIEQDSIINLFDMMGLIFNFNLNEYNLGKFLLELTLLDIQFYEYQRTLIALAVTYLVMKVNIERHQNYKNCFLYLKNQKHDEILLKSCSKQILKLWNDIKISKKYNSSLQKFDLLNQQNNDNEEIEMLF